MDELLTLKEIAGRLGVPESNLRYYRNRIGDFLPSIGKGRRRRYFPEAAEIFQKTIEYINDGVTLDRIYSIFAENKPLALRDDIARPAQEELADLIVRKIKEGLSLPLSLAEPGGVADAGDRALIEEELARMREEAASNESRLRAAVEENAALTAQLNEKEIQIQSLESGTGQNENLQPDEALLERIRNAETDAQFFKGRVAELEATVSNIETEKDALQNTLESNKQDIDQLRQEKEQVEIRLAERERIIEGQKDALDKARAKRIAIQEEYDRLKNSLQ